jgi:hypothetical protein
MSKAREIVETLRTVLVAGDVTNANFTGADLDIAKGGTGASTAGAARTALGVAIGTDVQAYDATILVDGDIGTSVLAPNGDGSALTNMVSVSAVTKPTITSPSNGETGFISAFTTSAYAVADTFVGTHTSSHWQVSLLSDFSTIVTESTVDNQVTWYAPLTATLTSMFVRVRHHSGDNVSDWSTTVSFTTPNNVIKPPSLTVAGSPSTVMSSIAVTTSAFAVFGGTADTHASTSWYLKLAGNVVWSSVNDTTNKTSITINFSGITVSTLYTLEVVHNGAALAGITSTTSFTTTAVFNGEAVYISAGTFAWVCPSNVTSISILCVGGGGSSSASTGAGGGELRYTNNFSVTAGTSYTVIVGSDGYGSQAGGFSKFNSTTTIANGGSYASGGTVSGGSGGTGDGGGNGGSGSGAANSYGSGGGAGGYSGAGGNGGNNNNHTAGAGGGGGGGASYIGNNYKIGHGGGGVGLYGIGANGAGWQGGGNGGSGGASTNARQGGNYGGGAGASQASGNGTGDGSGGGGAVRIIWGTNRTFPSNAS